MTTAALERCLDRLEVEPVLTAHPTEAKRRTTLGHLLRLVTRFDDPDEILETLWHTRETRERPMDPREELDRALFLVERTILPAVADFYHAFDRELARARGPVRARRGLPAAVATGHRRLLADRPVLAEPKGVRSPLAGTVETDNVGAADKPVTTGPSAYARTSRKLVVRAPTATSKRTFRLCCVVLSLRPEIAHEAKMRQLLATAGKRFRSDQRSSRARAVMFCVTAFLRASERGGGGLFDAGGLVVGVVVLQSRKAALRTSHDRTIRTSYFVLLTSYFLSRFFITYAPIIGLAARRRLQ